MRSKEMPVQLKEEVGLNWKKKSRPIREKERETHQKVQETTDDTWRAWLQILSLDKNNMFQNLRKWRPLQIKSLLQGAKPPITFKNKKDRKHLNQPAQVFGQMKPRRIKINEKKKSMRG